jgi:hypothetical protein
LYGVEIEVGGEIYGASHTHPYEDNEGMRGYPMFSLNDLYAFGRIVKGYHNPSQTTMDTSIFFLTLTVKVGQNSTATYALKMNDWVNVMDFIDRINHISVADRIDLQRELRERYQKSSQSLSGASQSDYLEDLFKFMEDENIKGLDIYKASDQNYTNWEKINYDNNSDTLLPSTNCNN